MTHLSCPPPRPTGLDGRSLLETLSLFMRSISGLEYLCFGLEARSVFLIEREALQRGKVLPPIRQLYLRPAFEPILFSFADRLKQVVPGDEALVDRFVSCLVGIAVAKRARASSSVPDESGAYVEYPAPAVAAGYLGRMLAGLPALDCPLDRAAYCYAQSILSHPYTDGNGRLARSFALLQLSSDLAGAVPFLPLGAVIYSRAEEVVGGLQELSRSGDWVSFAHVFRDALSTALDLAIRLLDTARR